MNNLTPQEQKKLLRLGKVLDGGAIAVLSELEKTEKKVDDIADELEEVKQAIPKLAELIPEIRQPEDGKDGRDGKDGENYVLTEQDKKEIAKAITVPVVEKVVEKTEVVIREVPVVTKEVVEKEVAVLDEATVAYLEDKIEEVNKLAKTTAKINSEKSDGIGLVVREVRAGTNITIDNSNQEYPIINALGGGASVWGGITGTLSDQTDLQTALDNKAPSLGTDDNYVTDAEKTKLSNLSGVNTGDQVIKDTFGITVDGAGAVLTTGSKGFRYIEQNCTITGWDIRSNISGSVVIDVKRSGVSIAGTEKPTLSSQQSNSDTSLSTWTVSLSAGDIIEFVVDSVSTITRVTLSVLITKI